MADNGDRKVVNELEVLTNYARTKKPGDVVDYVSAERDTGIFLGSKAQGGSRDKLGRALRKAGHLIEHMRDIGYRIVNGGTGCQALEVQVTKLVRAGDRVGEFGNALLSKFGDEMSPRDFDRASRMTSFVSSIRLSAAAPRSALVALPTPKTGEDKV